MLRGAVRTLGFQIALTMSVLIVAIGALSVWQVDAILRDNEQEHFTDMLARARGQLSQQLALDQELTVTGAVVLAADPEMRDAIERRAADPGAAEAADQEAADQEAAATMLRIAGEYHQRTGATLPGSPGLQVYDRQGNLMVRVHRPGLGAQGDQPTPREVRLAMATGDSVGSIRQDEVLGLAVSGVAPVVDARGAVVGAVEALTAVDRAFIAAQEHLLSVHLALVTTETTLVSAAGQQAPLLPGDVTEVDRGRIQEQGAAVVEMGGQRFLATLHTVADLDGDPLATFYLGVEESVILEGVGAVRLRAFQTTLAGGVVAVVLASGLAFLAVRPLRELVDAARRIQANDLETPVESSGPTEVVDLADALEDLRVAVRQTREAMLSVNRDLASRFDASTASLSEASQELAVMHGILAALGGDAAGGLTGVSEELAELEWVDGAGVALATEAGRLSTAALADLPPETMAALLAVVEGGLRDQRLEGGIVVAETAESPEAQHLAALGIGGFAAQPMVEPDGVAGLVVVTARRALHLTPSRAELLRSVSLEVAAMLERTELAGEVEENRRIAESVLREMSDGVLVINHANQCRVANPAAARMLGRSRLELVGRPAEEVLPLGEEAIATLRRRAAEPSLGPVAPLLAEADGRRIAVSAGPFVDADPERAGMMVLMRDLSAEAEAERVKQDFVSMVGHELRTPLTLIRTTIDLLNEGDAGQLNATQARIVEVLHANTDRLMMLINDLLDMSAIDSGRMQIQPATVDLVEVVRDAMQEAQPAASTKQHQIRLVAPEQVPAWADRKRVTQVLSNLVGNAIKYTPPGGVIDLRVEELEHWVRVAVGDNGIGIPPEEQGHLFEKFYRTTQGRRTTGGTGLGLAIARSLVELHGGRIWVDSDGYTGTTFTFTLPRWQI